MGAIAAALPRLEVSTTHVGRHGRNARHIKAPAIYALGEWPAAAFATTLERLLELAQRNDRGRRSVRRCDPPAIPQHLIVGEHWWIEGKWTAVTVAAIAAVAGAYAAASLERLWAAGGPRS